MPVFTPQMWNHSQCGHDRQRAERALLCLSQCLSAVIHATEEQALFQEICDITVSTGGYLFAWIGLADRDIDKSVRPAASAGHDAGYLQEVFISWSADHPSGRGPIGRAIRTRQPRFSRNTSRDRRFAPWREPALKRGFQAVAAFPLSLETGIEGVLAIYSQEDTFDQEEVDLFTRLAENVSYGLNALRTRIQRDEKQVLLHRNAYLLQERMKELNLLYTISRLKSREDLSLDEILQHITEAIPQAWQFPDMAEARIVAGNYGDFKTPGYIESSLSLIHPIELGGKSSGRVEIVYPRNPPGISGDVFLPEERTVIESIAQHVADILRHFENANEKRKLAGALEQAADTVVITDREGRIEYVNPSFEASTGFSRDEALGRKPNILKSGQHPPEFYAQMWETILSGEVYRDTVINRARDGSLFYEHKTITPLYDHQGRLTHFLATGKDLTEQVQTESRLEFLVSHDAITGLINHREFVRHVDQAISELPGDKSSLAVVVLGLDNFKTVNELLGRLTGDWILKQIGERLSLVTQSLVARLESDTFGFVLQGCPPKQTGPLVESYLAELARPLVLETEEVVVTATAGISCYPADGGQGLTLIQKADTAMSRAKNSGIQHFQFYTPDMQIHSLEQLRLNKKLLDALEQARFILYFQPQVHLTTGRLHGAEALVRWQTQDGRIVAPDEFIPVLEEMGRMGELGDLVLDQACSAFQRIKEAGVDLPCMAVNLAAPQLEEPELSHKITGALNAAGLSPGQLEFEVTESMLISKYERVRERLNELLNLGIGVALDDFGTGYSSLQYLTRYPFSKLKIDKSFVWNMDSGNKDREVVKAIISLGHSLNIRVLAEGVEKRAQVQSLRDLGCDLVQGYLYSPPLDESSFINYLQEFEENEELSSRSTI